MRELLQQAIAVIEKLPAEVQDAIATRLLAEAADEQAWAAQFEATTDTQWDRMAETVRRAIVAEDLTPLDDVFPPREPS
jgi:predicted GTPase